VGKSSPAGLFIRGSFLAERAGFGFSAESLDEELVTKLSPGWLVSEKKNYRAEKMAASKTKIVSSFAVFIFFFLQELVNWDFPFKLLKHIISSTRHQ